MLSDLQSLLDSLEGTGGKPCLVRLAVALCDTGPRTTYAWSTGRVRVMVARDGVRLTRLLGAVGDTVHLTLPELAQLEVAVVDWARRRHEWAAFYSSAGGYPVPYGHAWYHLAPGARSAPTRLGDVLMGQRRGESLTGKDEVVPLGAPIVLEGGVTVEAEVWRRGERRGPAAGSLTGCRYRLGEGLSLLARRTSAELRAGRRRFDVEAGEEALVAAVLEVVRSRGPRSRSGRRTP